MMPFFSVIIPTFNRARLIGEALDSVFAQEFADFEVIVVDDGSTDGTREALARYGGRVRYLRQENAGPGAARNAGIESAAGTYVAFLDSDDLWFPWTLAAYKRAIDENGGPAVIMGRGLYWRDRAEVAAVGPEDLRVLAFPDYLASSSSRFLRTACALAVRTDELRRVGGFAPQRMNAEDHDLLYRLGTAAGFVALLAPTTVAYRQHAGSASSQQEAAYRGVMHQLDQERHGGYPGDGARRRQRRRMISLGARYVSWDLLKKGRLGWAWDLYRRGFRYQLAHRPRYLAAFPVLAAARWARAWRRRR